jgi:hypothetical protein
MGTARSFVLLLALRQLLPADEGEADDGLSCLGFAQLTLVRPSLIADDGTRPEMRIGERIALPISRAVFSIVGKERRYAPIRRSDCAMSAARRTSRAPICSLAPLSLALLARPLSRADVTLGCREERARAPRGAPVDAISRPSSASTT